MTLAALRTAFLLAVPVLAGCESMPALDADSTTVGDAALAQLSSGAATSSLGSLPVDDGRYTTGAPRKTWVYSCQSFPSGSGSQSLPWVSGQTWNSKEKVKVRGTVGWTRSLTIVRRGTQRTISGNGLPGHQTGTFPISPSDPAYEYDQNPNAIAPQSVSYSIPANPAVAAAPSCLNMGPIGIMLTGAQLFNAFDAQGRDAAVHELLDSCWGHPQQQGAYHYHTFSACMGDSVTGHSKLLGYALDGFGIYGPRGQDGTVLWSNDLDECHGHAHVIAWNGKRVTMYHYHFTYDFPYSLGCYRGSP
ncbi:MAG: YHYH protein [Candidatus Eremiobacteraeota bacterium]|nr:YHYH protein [Candidatus Eremiobacteraeota bacterium]MBV8721882.1 YHYH protein [Candidatus Eremiobacteraeota bacterium]